MWLVALLLFVSLHGVDHPVLPPRGVPPVGHVIQTEELREVEVDLAAPRRLVRHLPQHVRQIVEGVDHVVDIRLLEVLDVRGEGQDLVIQDGLDPDPFNKRIDPRCAYS